MARLTAPFHGRQQRPQLFVALRLPDAPPRSARFLLDTGSDFTVIAASTWKAALRRPPRSSGPPKTIYGVGGSATCLPVGPAVLTFRTDDEDVRIQLDKVYLADDKLPANLLGTDFFRAVGASVTFDYRQDQAVLEFETPPRP